MEKNISYAAKKVAFKPWEVPDDFTIYDFAPEEIRSFLHPHWHTQKAPHPVLFYALGLWFFITGNDAYRCLFPVLMTMSFAATVGILGNYIVLRIFSGTKDLRTPSNMLVLNLAVADILLLVTMLPEMIFNFFTGGPWRQGELACFVHSFCGKPETTPIVYKTKAVTFNFLAFQDNLVSLNHI